MVACTYFWSGLQKIAGDFSRDVFPWMAEPVARALPAPLRHFVDVFGVAAPFTEAAIGIGLLFEPTRMAAAGGAIAMHLFILAGIGPWGHNTNNVVWPWNLVMIAAVLLLFTKAQAGTFSRIVWRPSSKLHWATLLLVGFAPALSFFNLWDSYLSSALYAGNKNDGALYVSDGVLDRLPDAVQDLAEEEQPGISKIEISDWSYRELNVPPYPEIRIYRNVARTLCGYAVNGGDVKLEITRKKALFGGGGKLQFDCASSGFRGGQVSRR